MAVDEESPALRFERPLQPARNQFLGQEFVQEENARGHGLGFGAGDEAGIVVAEGEEAARFQADDGDAGAGKGQQGSDHRPRPVFGLLHQPLAEQGPAATAPRRHLHAETGGLQHSQGGQPLFRLVELGEGVGKEGDRARHRAGDRSPGFGSLRKGALEAR